MPAGPFVRVDHLVIAVRDLAAAERDYGTVLGCAPSSRAVHTELGTGNVIFALANCYLELLALGPAPPTHPVAHALAAFLEDVPEGVFAVALGSDDLDATARTLGAAGLTVGTPADLAIAEADGRMRTARLLPIDRAQTRGVNVFGVMHDRAAIPLAVPRGAPAAAVSAVDHLVLFSDDLDGALRLWRDAFAIPERWRREFPDRGTVNVGLRLGGVTVELVAPHGTTRGERGERLWGLAYAVGDCDAAVARLRAEGAAVSDARPGLAPATRVATVKWKDRVPTLLIQQI